MKRFSITQCFRLLILSLVTLTCFLLLRTYFRSSREDEVPAIKFLLPRGTAFASNEVCSDMKVCEPGTLSLILSSESQFSSPVVCFNKRRLFEEAKLVRGLNIAVINENSQSVEAVYYISLLENDHDLIQQLSTIENHRVIVIASYGDVASKLSAEARQLLVIYGSSLLEKYRSGNSLLFVGQRGLTTSASFEKVLSLSLSNPLRSQLCVTVPMGELTEVTREKAVLHRIDENQKSKLSLVKGGKMNITYGNEFENCGNSVPCKKDELAMYFYSGKDKDDAPRICIDGHFVIDRDLNDAGRGLNLVVIDGKTRQIVRVGHFDTYEEEDVNLIVFLEQLTPGEIVAVVSFDEAASKLSDTAKKIFLELGSSWINNIKFRASWYFVGQNGIDSFSPFEDMYLPSGNDWAKPIDISRCVPLNLNSYKPPKRLHVVAPSNSAKRHFCEKYDGYEAFCREDQLDIVPMVKTLKNGSRSSRPVYSLPILFSGGLNRNNIRLCLESLLEQEGINLQNIVVSFDALYPEVADLASLFHARSLPIVNISSYDELVMKSVSQLMELYPSSPCIIVIEEDTLLSHDFLYFVDQLLDVFLSDDSVNVIQLFNKNAFLQTSSMVSSVYRFENATFTKAFVLKRSAFEQFVKNEQTKCCKSVESWVLPGFSYVPDVSRVMIIESGTDQISKLENKRRRYITEGNVLLQDVDKLKEAAYDAALKKLISKSKKVILFEIADCQLGSVLESPVKLLKLLPWQPFSVIFPMKRSSLSVLFHCFHLGNDVSYGMYKGVVRFSINGRPALLVSSNSPLVVTAKIH